jgi:hypothetical protein
MAEPTSGAAGGLAPAELQARLARAYLSGNGDEVEKVLALVAKADYKLPPKTDRAS